VVPPDREGFPNRATRAGEDLAREARDPLNDVIRVWDAFIDRPALHWGTLAQLLAEHLPERYADATGDEISALLRSGGVPSVPVKVDGQGARGVRREHLEQALQRQQLGNGNGDRLPATRLRRPLGDDTDRGVTP
jgi:hypothetical protein